MGRGTLPCEFACPFPMSRTTSLFKSSLGLKYIMAVTGVLLFLFVVGHLIGNLQIFGPPELINQYGHFLHGKPLLLWGVRLSLLAIVGLHIASAAQLTVMNKEARPIGYAAPTAYGSTWQSRYMLVSGLVILAFVLYHLAHFTALLPGINGVGDFRELEVTLPGGAKAHDVYGMMVLGFQVWWVTLFYLVAQALLFVHLGHGLASMFQSLGFRNHVWWPRIEWFAKAASIAILVGYAVIPIAIYMRVVGADYAEKVKHKLASPLDTQLPGAGEEAVEVIARELSSVPGREAK
jgi:succinate dehydrogenase / fumarate reductase cytochrome b subunit